jgi:hypothetical protein
MRTRTILFIASVLLVYVGSWLFLAEQVMLRENTRRIWSDWDVQKFAPNAPLYLCTNLTRRDTVVESGRAAEVMPREKCNSMGVLDSLQHAAVRRASDSSSSQGIVVAYAVADIQTPLVTRNGVGYWFFGSDHVEVCDEWITWAFFRWIVLYESNGTDCQLSEKRDT